MTATQLVAGIEDGWYAAKLPVNQPIDVGNVLLDVTRSEDIHGKAFYIEGGRAWEIEDNIDRLEPQWLGEEQSRILEKGQAVLGNVSRTRTIIGERSLTFSGHRLDEQTEVMMLPWPFTNREGLNGF